MGRGRKRKTEKAEEQPGSMAEERKPFTPEGEAQAEIDVLRQLGPHVNDGFARILELEREIDALKAEQITPLAEQRKEAWTAIREATKMLREDLGPYYAIYKRVQAIKAFEDEAARETCLANLRRLYHVLPTGAQMDFIDAVSGPTSSAPSDPPKSAYKEGARDHGAGMPFDKCPYRDSDPVNRDAWQNGWLRARDDWEKHAPPSDKPAAPVEPGATAH